MTKQEMFDTALEGLRKQGEPSMNTYGGCLFRGPFNNKCAVGMLILDEEYNPDMEHYSLDKVVKKCSTLSMEDVEFLLDMQREMHDGPSAEINFVPLMELGAQLVAKKWELDYGIPR